MHGVPTFVRCGADILLTGLREDVDGEARCPVCNSAIRFRIRDRAVENLHPPGALLHVVEAWRGSGTWIECVGTHMFDTTECLEGWRRSHPHWHGRVSGLQEYMDLCVARRDVGRTLNAR